VDVHIKLYFPSFVVVAVPTAIKVFIDKQLGRRQLWLVYAPVLILAQRNPVSSAINVWFFVVYHVNVPN
jgi:hypothetical protein